MCNVGYADAINSTAGATSYNSNSITLTNNRKYALAALSLRAAGTPNDPTVSGWTSGGTPVSVGTTLKLSLFQRTGDGSTGAQTVDYGGQTQDAHALIIVDITDIDLASPFVQYVTDTSAPGTTTDPVLAAFSSTRNGVLAFCGIAANSGTLRGKTGYSAPYNNADTTAGLGGTYPQRNADGLSLTIQWRADANDTAPSFTHTNTNSVGLAVELRSNLSAGGGGPLVGTSRLAA